MILIFTKKKNINIQMSLLKKIIAFFSISFKVYAMVINEVFQHQIWKSNESDTQSPDTGSSKLSMRNFRYGTINVNLLFAYIATWFFNKYGYFAVQWLVWKSNNRLINNIPTHYPNKKIQGHSVSVPRCVVFN